MALINCPDCNSKISDSAINCIHCGRPMQQSRESILAEIQNALIEQQNIDNLIDNIDYGDNFDAGRSNILHQKFENVRKRISELKAMLK